MERRWEAARGRTATTREGGGSGVAQRGGGGRRPGGGARGEGRGAAREELGGGRAAMREEGWWSSTSFDLREVGRGGELAVETGIAAKLLLWSPLSSSASSSTLTISCSPAPCLPCSPAAAS
ncbi:Os02g0139900 [Oryza sativa Japonica Group]|uniref:Os02g0139900 protein n=2 Tax=Oryza sativa subsp. japonica TaxID=39947 RepID=Q0E425_ORYSJ|nr:Os02g0139900 [Oryza sativa Japonica Group]BAS76912.1 Os02g0139900 [Oryza sativa Japonica Group]|eukprot:NP_001045849.1 Os02g0139900 [Oryza sativa Japonica Group]